MILNPNGKCYSSLKKALNEDYEDLLWCEDVVFLERNSRTFKERSAVINKNTEALCDFLNTHEQGKLIIVFHIIMMTHFVNFFFSKKNSRACILSQIYMQGKL